jgi:hypothetical protein
MVSIVVYKPVAKRWLCEQRPFLGNGSVNTFPLLGRSFLKKQQLEYNNGNGVFLRGPCRDVMYKEKVSCQLSFAREDLKRGPQQVKLKNLHC